jgi:Phosphotransferase enzyme family
MGPANGEDPESHRHDAGTAPRPGVAAIAPLPVLEPVLVAADVGGLAYRRLPGTPLLDVPQPQWAGRAPAIATDLGRLLRALHAAAVGPDRQPHRPRRNPPSERLEEAALQ